MKKIILANAVIIVSFVIVLITPKSVSAESRLEYCNNLASDAGSADSRERNVQNCLDNLNEKAFYTCIERPESERGQCAEDYKNAAVEETEKLELSSLEPPVPITNEDREALVNCDGSNDPSKCLEENPIVARLIQAINVLSIGIGVIVTIMIIVGGIQYASAGGNPQKVQAAKTRITNAIIALIAYFFLFAFLQWLIPGGII